MCCLPAALTMKLENAKSCCGFFDRVCEKLNAFIVQSIYILPSANLANIRDQDLAPISLRLMVARGSQSLSLTSFFINQLHIRVIDVTNVKP